MIIKKFNIFEKLNNKEGSLISQEDVLNAIKRQLDITFFHKNKSLTSVPLSVDNDGLIVFDIDGLLIEVDMKDVIKIDNL